MSRIFSLVADSLINDLVNALVAFILAFLGVGASG